MKKTFTTEGLSEITTQRRCKTSQKLKFKYFHPAKRPIAALLLLVWTSSELSPGGVTPKLCISPWRRAKTGRTRGDTRITFPQKDGCDCCSPHPEQTGLSRSHTWPETLGTHRAAPTGHKGGQTQQPGNAPTPLAPRLEPLNGTKIKWNKNSLLCAVDELVFVGPLEASFHAFVVPQLLCVIKELLRK